MKPLSLLLLFLLITTTAYGDWLDDIKQQGVELEISRATREILNQFPFLQILDDWTDITSGIVLFECLDKRDNKKCDVFYRYWDGKWIKRYPAKSEKKHPDDPYTFEELN